MCANLNCIFAAFAFSLLAAGMPAIAQAVDEPSRSPAFTDQADLALDQQAPPAATADPFDKGSRVLTAYGATTVGDSDHGYMHTGHLGGHYYFADNQSIGIDLFGGYVNPELRRYRATPDDDGVVGGFDLILRWHFVREGDVSLYLDGGAGFQIADTDFPSDTHYNFRPQVGLGATWQVGENWHLMGGVRYLHASNAATSENNDGGDWAQPYLGIMVPF